MLAAAPISNHDPRTTKRNLATFAEATARASALRTTCLAFLAVALVLWGQLGRELLPPDDLREAEVAREMWQGRDFVVPHFAGQPFLEKPPGFPAVVAVAYGLVGRPSVAAARAVSVGFALATLLAVFLIARRALGIEAAGWAVALLAVSARFVRTAHEVLLDNALVATTAFALLFLWIALDAASPGGKRRASAACAFCLGLSFLVKGFVGPALFGAGIVTYLLGSGRSSEWRHVWSVTSMLSFLAPVLVWLVPFLQQGTPIEIRTFLVDNQFGRFWSGFESHVHAPSFYVGLIWCEFAPTILLVPLAAVAAVLDTLTIMPEPRARMIGTTCWHMLKILRTSTLKLQSH
ncbi:MAG: glycosyltransferase family 39 protein [Planctomycetes bacterium]|nr:glycosyltransferase family 39 protein [Planctomycetota bacterium]